jgi:putative molybdopterin biosynthesis protein
MSEELLNTKEAAQYLGVHQKQLYMLVKEKRIPATRVTGKWIFPRKLLDEWIEGDARKNLSQAGERARQRDGALLGAGSDDPVLKLLAGELRNSGPPETVLFLAAFGSAEGLKALNRGDVDLSFSRLFDPETGDYNLPFLPRLVPDRRVAAINCFHREIGFVVPQGNPRHVRSFEDLGKNGIRLVNRPAGSEMRVFLEQELAKAGVSPRRIAGWDLEATSDHEVALAVYTGAADVGIAAASVAGPTGLGFVPLREERLDVVLERSIFFERRFQALLDRLTSSAFKRRAGRMGGYDFRDCGTVLTREQ